MLTQNHTTTEYTRFEKWKVLAHSNRVDMIRKNIIPPPVTLVVYPTNMCTYQCGHCIMKEEKETYPVSLSSKTMGKIADDVIRWGVKCVVFSGGGDPLIHPDTIDVARELHFRGVKTALNTNGIAITENLSSVVKESFDYIRISVDAATKETYNAVHCFDGWDKINTVLSMLSVNRKSELGLAFLITPDNYYEVIPFCDWAQKFNFDFIHIRPAFLPLSDIKDIVLTYHKLWEGEIKNYKNVHFRLDKFNGYWTAKTYSKCWANTLTAVLAADGSFFTCQDVFSRFGNYNIMSFEEIWWGKEHIETIKDIRLEDCPRCVANGYNEIIENWDKLKMEVL